MTAPRITPEHARALCRDDFGFFSRGGMKTLLPNVDIKWNWHNDLIANRLEDVVLGRCRRLIINMPPRYGKSLMGSVFLPAWVLGRDPSAQILCASYAQGLSEKMARDMRRLMNNLWYQSIFGTRLVSRRARLRELCTTGGGTRLATSVDGSVTGRGGNLVIIDDPLKPGEAHSNTQRQAANQWFDNTVSSRLDDKEAGGIILIMQRLHEDDLAGHLLAKGGWEHLTLPILAEEDEVHRIRTPLGARVHRRAQGELLHPERESLECVMATQKEMGSYEFAAQCQQSPAPAGGGMVKVEWFRDYDPDQRPAFSHIMQSWDTASKDGKDNDYSVCTTWGMAGDEVWLLDVFQRRFLYPELKRKVRELAALHKAGTVLIEEAGSGIQLVQELRTEGFARIEGVKVSISKTQRLEAQTARIEAGKVRIPATAHWREAYLAEFEMFPNGRFDDQVDSTAQALAWIHTSSGPARWLAMMEEANRQRREEGG